MLDGKRLHDIEQGIETAIELWPPLLRRFYIALVAQGFAESQAFVLTLEYMKSTISMPVMKK